jgi:hypothetical protein
MYNNLLVLALVVTLYSTLRVNDRLAFFIMAPCIELSTTNVVIAAFLPSVLIELKVLYTSSSRTGDSSKVKSCKEMEWEGNLQLFVAYSKDRTEVSAVKKSVSDDKGMEIDMESESPK